MKKNRNIPDAPRRAAPPNTPPPAEVELPPGFDSWLRFYAVMEARITRLNRDFNDKTPFVYLFHVKLNEPPIKFFYSFQQLKALVFNELRAKFENKDLTTVLESMYKSSAEPGDVARIIQELNRMRYELNDPTL